MVRHSEGWNPNNHSIWENTRDMVQNSSFGSFLRSVFSSGVLQNKVKQLSGSGLTDAEKEANAFSAQQAELAFNRELEASNTQYQRKVADLQAAGINPMLAAGSGVSVPAAHAAASVSPSAGSFQLPELFGMFKQLKMMPAEIESLKAKKALDEASALKMKEDAKKAASETKHLDILNNYAEAKEQLSLEGMRKGQALTEAQTSGVWQSIYESRERVKKLIAETKNEEDRNDLILAEMVLTRANAYRIAYLVPFEAELMSAQSEQQKAAASYALVQAAYQQGLIDNGFIESTCQKLGYERDSAEYRASVDRVHGQLAGDLPAGDTKFDRIVGTMAKAIGWTVNHCSPKLLQ